MTARAVLGLAAVLLLAATAHPSGAEVCGQAAYQGFDSRLEPRVVGRIPAGTVAGFEITGGAAVVALPDRLLAFREGKGVEVPLARPPSGLAADSDGTLWVQSGGSLASVGTNGPEMAASGLRGRLLDSGDARLLRLVEEAGHASFLLHDRSGAEFPLASFDAPVRAATWGPEGLTAVVGDRLLTWAPGARDMQIWMADAGLAKARDVCRLDNDHVVIALSDLVLHASRETAQVLAAGFSARCRFHGKELVLLDEQSGLLWAVGGIEKLGRKEGDAAHARQLLANLPAGTGASDFRFQEAVRLVGCSAAKASFGARSTAAASTAAVASAAAAPTAGTAASGARAAGLMFQPAWLGGAGGDGLTLRVVPGSAAQVAGLQSGDRLVSVGGKAAETLDAAEAAFTAAGRGARVAVVVLRGGSRVTATLSLP